MNVYGGCPCDERDGCVGGEDEDNREVLYAMRKNNHNSNWPPAISLLHY